MDSPSAGQNSVMTDEAYTAGLVAVSEYRRNLYRILARSRYHEYVRRLGQSRFRMLEIGCGNAGMAEEFQRQGAEYFGIDLDERPVAVALARGLQNVRVADFLTLADEEPYDVIVASQVLEHITHPRTFVEKVARWLRPGGIVHLDVPSHRSLAALASRFVLKSKNRWGAIEWPHHLFAYSRESLGLLLAQHFECQLITAACDDRLWGQAHEPHLPSLLYYRLSAILRAPSILVAIGRRK
jgi:2-polyprenyl-3-methyl-5-hydroxy-6-metoxy-1,4-benzoquinol methylase